MIVHLLGSLAHHRPNSSIRKPGMEWITILFEDVYMIIHSSYRRDRVKFNYTYSPPASNECIAVASNSIVFLIFLSFYRFVFY